MRSFTSSPSRPFVLPVSLPRAIHRRYLSSCIATATMGVLFMSVPAVQAQTNILSNLGNSTNGTLSFNNSLAQGFSIGATSVSLQSVTLTLYVDKSAQLDLSLYSDNGGKPGTEVSAIGSMSLSRENGDFTFTAPAPLTLAANTNYWAVVQSDDAFTEWYYSDVTSGSTSDVGAFFTGNASSNDSGGTWTTNAAPGSNFQMALTAAAATVPETDTGSLALLGTVPLAGMLLLRQRKRRFKEQVASVGSE